MSSTIAKYLNSSFLCRIASIWSIRVSAHTSTSGLTVATTCETSTWQKVLALMYYYLYTLKVDSLCKIKYEDWKTCSAYRRWEGSMSIVVLPKHSQMNLKDWSAANSQFRYRDIASSIHVPDPKMHSKCSHQCPPSSGRSFGQQTVKVKVLYGTVCAYIKQMKFRDWRACRMWTWWLGMWARAYGPWVWAGRIWA